MSDDEADAKGGRGGGVVQNKAHDEEFELSQSLESFDAKAIGGADAKGDGAGGLGVETNKPYDEAVDLSDNSEDSVDSLDTTEEAARKAPASDAADAKGGRLGGAAPAPVSMPAATPATKGPGGPAPGAAPAPRRKAAAADGTDDEESSEDDDDDEGGGSARKVENEYSAKDYAHLNVSAEVKDLFQYIGRYKAHDVDLESTFKAFVPDYCPAVGQMDAFVKVPRPDADRDELGLKVLDEPAASQSDATVLELQLRAVSKKQHGDVAVRAIEGAAKAPGEIERWIESITDLHRSKPPPQVHYKKQMPDIDALMQEWPEKFEQMLNEVSLPPVDCELSLEDTARVMCAIMDVPVYDNNYVESLHLLFTLYMEFKENVHFNAMANDGGGGAPIEAS